MSKTKEHNNWYNVELNKDELKEGLYYEMMSKNNFFPIIKYSAFVVQKFKYHVLLEIAPINLPTRYDEPIPYNICVNYVDIGTEYHFKKMRR